MDEKIMGMLSQILEKQMEMSDQITGLKDDVAGLKTDVAGLKTEMVAVKSRGEKNTMLLEQTEQHIRIFGEGLASFREQVDRQFEGVHLAFDEKIDILETPNLPMAKVSLKPGACG
ncbi:MAG: hypothetical protein QMC95_11410 [Desulfitobacteriaceae bacterium]|nr:hypothetical protein [Desulfitobacteriaceae bacterium]MDI6914816.1 hypothetical protein [Desulfitobacteriaceae bacterium]